MCHFGGPGVTRPSVFPPLTAIVYTDGPTVDATMRRIAGDLIVSGLRVAGFLQVSQSRPGRSRCDMVLEEIASGQRVLISEDRGAHARGCRLDLAELARVEILAIEAIACQPDLFVINKFGKTEAHGGGLRSVVMAAIDREVPVLIAVPAHNLVAWRSFSGALNRELRVDDLAKTSATLLALPSSSSDHLEGLLTA